MMCKECKRRPAKYSDLKLCDECLLKKFSGFMRGRFR